MTLMFVVQEKEKINLNGEKLIFYQRKLMKKMRKMRKKKKRMKKMMNQKMSKKKL